MYDVVFLLPRRVVSFVDVCDGRLKMKIELSLCRYTYIGKTTTGKNDREGKLLLTPRIPKAFRCCYCSVVVVVEGEWKGQRLPYIVCLLVSVVLHLQFRTVEG